MEGRTSPLGHVMSNTRARKTPAFQRSDTFADWIIDHIYLPMTKAQMREREQAVNREPPSNCGTRAAYLRHHYKGEPPCQLCIQANREYGQRRARQQKVAA